MLEAVSRSPRRRLHAAVAAVVASLFGASAFVAAEAPAVAVRTVVRVEAPPPAGAIEIEDDAPRAAPYAEPPAARDAHLALYAEAHRLHFEQRDAAAALAAWDRYLAAAPAGPLAPEARFNRTVCFVRLARWDDAALAFASLDPTHRPDELARLRGWIEARGR